MKNRSANTAGELFEGLRSSSATQREADMANGLVFLAQSIDELHDKVDAIEEGKFGFKMDITKSIEDRLKAVGLIK